VSGSNYTAIPAAAVLAAVLLLPGCARAPAAAGGGTRLVVFARFAGPINPNFQYFFLIRNANDPSASNGPISVIEPPYGNGFATAASPGSPTAGFTDFVEYSRVQRTVLTTGYTVYHLPGGVNGDPNRNIFEVRGEPDIAIVPNGGSVLRFELDLSRLQPNPGEPDPNGGNPPRFLQVNLVATTTTPANPSVPDPNKFVDAFGEQRLGSGTFNSFVTLDASQVGRVYQSNSIPGDPQYEPDNDTYPAASDPAVEMTAWSIQIQGGR